MRNQVLKKKTWKKWYKKNRTKRLAYTQKWRKENKDKWAGDNRRWENKHPERYLFGQAKRRAVRKKVPFTITLEDVKIPECCPILGIKFERGTRAKRDNAPSLDRIRPELGYVKGNVVVISFMANKVKNDVTDPEVFIKIAEYLRQHQKEGT